MVSSPPELAPRAVRPGDAEAVVGLVAARGERLGVRIDFGLEDLRDHWRRIDLERDAWAWEHDGRLVAFGILYARADEFFADGFVHPDFLGRGLGTAILGAAEARARERGAAKLETGALVADRAAPSLLAANGYREVRRYFKMTIELDAPPPEPEWPEGLDPRPFEREHARAFWAADDEAFADERGYVTEPFDEFVEKRLGREGFDSALWTAVWDGDEIAATLIADRRSSAGWIAGLAVRRPWRRRGLGLALLLRSFGQFYERGEQRVCLSVDSENPSGATRLYERAGMHVEREEVLYEKVFA
jgi:mycothiol synthase